MIHDTFDMYSRMFFNLKFLIKQAVFRVLLSDSFPELKGDRSNILFPTANLWQLI